MSRAIVYTPQPWVLHTEGGIGKNHIPFVRGPLKERMNPNPKVILDIGRDHLQPHPVHTTGQKSFAGSTLPDLQGSVDKGQDWIQSVHRCLAIIFSRDLLVGREIGETGNKYRLAQEFLYPAVKFTFYH